MRVLISTRPGRPLRSLDSLRPRPAARKPRGRGRGARLRRADDRGGRPRPSPDPRSAAAGPLADPRNGTHARRRRRQRARGRRHLHPHRHPRRLPAPARRDRQRRPDIVLYSLRVRRRLAAEAAGVPAVTVGITLGVHMHRLGPAIAEALDEVRAEIGLGPMRLERLAATPSSAPRRRRRRRLRASRARWRAARPGRGLRRRACRRCCAGGYGPCWWRARARARSACRPCPERGA